jgi:hypothetical protein
MSLKPLSEHQCYESFRAYEAHIEKEVKTGLLNGEQARSLLSQARKNYSNQNYNRNLEKCGKK